MLEQVGQALPGQGLFENPLLGFLIIWIPFILFMFYGQRIQTWMILNDVGRSLSKLEVMKNRARKEVIEYISSQAGLQQDPAAAKIDQFLEYFTIMPVNLDPAGIVRKIEHVMTTRDDRVREEIRRFTGVDDLVKVSKMENMVEVATALNFIYKVVRHFYLMGKKTSSLYVLIQLQMLMPMILQEADALMNAVDAIKKSQPIGDGIGAMVVGRMMLGLEKRRIAKDTVLGETEYKGRHLYLIKAEGPGGNVGKPGEALERLIEEMGLRPKAIVMIDAALKLEGEKTGEVAEGVGAAIGGIGVDRYKIEEVATRHKIPLYAVVIKQSIVEAISVMLKEIAETSDKVLKIVTRIIEEKTEQGDRVVVVGVGNTLGVAQ
jgi:hypothetical protein